jgi:outer membrane protein assembly factor BamB
MNRVVKVAALGAACVALSACSTLSNLNPFNRDKGPQAIASKGERIPVLTYDQSVTASESLAGIDYLIPDPQPVTAWPLPGGNAEQAMENMAAGSAFQVAWKKGVGDGSNRKRQVTAPPVALDGRIFTMDGDADVTASDAKSGAQVWKTSVRAESKRDKEGFGGGLAVANGKVFVTSGYRVVAALDAASGKVLWRKTVESPIHAAPTAANGRIYAVDIDNQIIAFDQETGDQTWSYQALVESARILRASSPAVSGDAVIAPFSSGELIALRTANGNLLWNESLSRTSRTNALSEIRDIPGRPAVYRGDVYAVSQSGLMAAVDLRTGNSRWQLPVSSVNSPWPAGDAVFVLSKAGEMVAVNRDSGQVYWVVDLNEGRKGRKEGGFLKMGGREVRPIWTGPVLADNRLVVVNNWGEAVALNAKTGAREKSLKIGKGAYIAPIAYDGMLYVVTDDAELVAIR